MRGLGCEVDSNWERGRGTTKWVESLNNRRAKLKLCMFDRVRPIVLYCHRLQGIEKRIVVQTVHLVRVILQNKETMVRFNEVEVYTVPGVGAGRGATGQRILTLTRIVLSSM